MTYIYRCHVCGSSFNSFESLTEHKKLELDQVASIKRANPDWNLRQCFEHLRRESPPAGGPAYAGAA